MFSLYEYLQRVEKRPGMHIGGRCILTLNGFINGFYRGLNIGSTGEDKIDSRSPDWIEVESPPFWQFHDFVALKYGRYESTAGWKNILLEEANHDSARAFDLFFNSFEQFRKLKPVLLRRLRMKSKHQPTGNVIRSNSREFRVREIAIVYYSTDLLFYGFYFSADTASGYLRKMEAPLDHWSARSLEESIQKAQHEFRIDSEDWEVVEQVVEE